ncbi:DM13 domain-containing protein [Alteromonas sp. AMM-1]|uniref:DM13 domain-containing protein n=1 Tax=Alteromonas sp. AMM-1 TaxID=3394233 RepID=UPI0039A6A242
MKSLRLIILLLSHLVIGIMGFAIGIYSLPILTAPASPELAQLEKASANRRYQAEFTNNLAGSDVLHWGNGQVTVGPDFITLTGELSPGPDFKLYLSPEFVETEAQFKALKSTMVRVGDVRTFTHFIVPVDSNINIDEYTTLIVWCESFEQFITAAKYQ